MIWNCLGSKDSAHVGRWEVKEAPDTKYSKVYDCTS